MDIGSASDWVSLAAALITGGGAGAVAREGLVWARTRGERHVSEAEQIRDELRVTIDSLKADINSLKVDLKARDERLEKRDATIETMRAEHFTLLEKYAEIVSEGHKIRGENHQLRSYLTVLYARMQLTFRKHGLPDDDLPPLPEWLFESTDGPTKGTISEHGPHGV